MYLSVWLILLLVVVAVVSFLQFKKQRQVMSRRIEELESWYVETLLSTALGGSIDERRSERHDVEEGVFAYYDQEKSARQKAIDIWYYWAFRLIGKHLGYKVTFDRSGRVATKKSDEFYGIKSEGREAAIIAFGEALVGMTDKYENWGGPYLLRMCFELLYQVDGNYMEYPAVSSGRTMSEELFPEIKDDERWKRVRREISFRKRFIGGSFSRESTSDEYSVWAKDVKVPSLSNDV